MISADMFRGPKGRASAAQGGVVLLSVTGLLLLLSLLASAAATQLSWNSQASRHWTQAAGDRMIQHRWIVELYRLNPGSLVAGVDSVDCYVLADACVHFAGEHSSGDTWRFVVEAKDAQGANTPAKIRGWLRRRAGDTTQVAAVWVQGQGLP